MSKITNVDQKRLESLEKNKKTTNQSIKEAINILKFDASISEIKDNKDFNNSENILNVSYLSIINKKEKDNNFSGTTKNEEYRSTDNISTKSKKKKLIKVFSESQNIEIDKSLKFDSIKNSKDSSSENNSDKNKISNYFSTELVNKISEDIDLNNSEDFFESNFKGCRNNHDSFSQSEKKLKSLFLKFEKSRTKSFIASQIRKNSNFSLNLNFKKDLLNDKNIDQNIFEANNITEQKKSNNKASIDINRALCINNESDEYSNLSNMELSKFIFEKINKNKDITEINLPARYISLPYLNIKKNLKIKGSPGTLLEIKNGFILINKNIQASFSECSFVFNYEQSNFIEKLDSGIEKYSKILNEKKTENSYNNKTIYKISCIKLSHNSQLEINDCDFRSIVHENEEIFEYENKQINETLIDCELINENVFNNDNNYAKLSLNSSIFSNFSSILEANFIKIIKVDNCHFSELSNSAFLVKNFCEFSLENSVITNASGNAVEVFDCDAIKASMKTKVSIKIKNCQIYANEKNAILFKNYSINENNKKPISDENKYTNSFPRHLSNKNNSTLDVFEITKNKIYQNKGIGIIIHNYNLKTFEIIENQIEENLLGNIFINTQIKFDNSSISSMSSTDTDTLLPGVTYNNKNEENNFLQTNKNEFNNFNLGKVNYSEFDFIIIKNEIKNSYSAFGLKIQNCVNIKILIENNHIKNNLFGIQIANNTSIVTMSKNAYINSNLDSGVILSSNKINSNFYFFECYINKNHNYGIQVKSLFNMPLKNDIINYNANENNEIKILKGEINYNNIGLGFESYLCKLDQCKLINNKSFAVEINDQKFKENLKLFNYPKNTNNMINSPIGGNWGIFNSDKCVCQSGKCLIF